MSETAWPGLHGSVFTRLAAIMVAMAVGLLVSVSVFFWFVVGVDVHASMDRVLRDYTARVAQTRPDFTAAKALKAEVNVDTRYEGPAGNWATNERMATAADVRQGRVATNFTWLTRRNHYVVPAPGGGTYLFSWSAGQRMGEAHTKLMIALLVTMALVMVAAYVVLSRLLRPLRTLSDGVARLGAGDLGVMLSNATNDEFGRVTEAFNRMAARVRAMIDARDHLLLDVSHELRSPLTRMKVALELVPENPQRAGMIADVTEMERMIAELLELERLRNGQSLRKSRQDLAPILREVAAQFAGTPPGVQVVSSAPALPVEIDADKIRAVVRNLLENAAKYSLPDSLPVQIVATQEPGRIVVRLTDHGPGIPESEAERIFEPFFRVDQSRSKNTGGYGLGLSLCKRVMQAHGGEITLDRTRTKGASFVLRFPSAALDRQSGSDIV